MGPVADPRYSVLSILRDAEDRATWMARDGLTGCDVIIKTGPRRLVTREMSALLALPPGIAPRARDGVLSADGAFLLVQERLEGWTLLEAAQRMELDRVGPVVLSILRVLEGLHRAGFVHADLKPSNVFVLAGDGARAGGPSDAARPPDVRLLDLGYAWSGRALNDPEEGPDLLGGTPPFTAPEIVRGWAVDGRADLYSLGVLIARLWPDLERDSVWRPVLDRLRAPSPSARYADAGTARRAVAERTEAPDAPWIPRFGAGPMRARNAELRRVVRAGRNSDPGALILVQARPGVGLTRFLLESMIALAREGVCAARGLDLGSTDAENGGASSLSAFLRDRLAAGEAVLAGVGDPSPSLRWPGNALAPPLRAFLLERATARLVLPPVSRETFDEIVASSLGSAAGAAPAIAQVLYERVEGALAEAAEAFDAAAREGVDGGVSDAGILEALSRKTDPPRGPALADLAEDLPAALGIVARAGISMPVAVACNLLERFADADAFARLVEHGLLLRADDERVAFALANLRAEALASPPARARDVDEWLHRNVRPAPGRADDILEAARRARALGDATAEGVYLAAGLRAAEEAQRWSDVLRILEYPDSPPSWTVDEATRWSADLGSRLGAEWPAQRLLLLAGRALYTLGRAVGLDIVARAAADADTADGVEALVQFTYWLRTAGRMEETEIPWARLERLEREGKSPAPGVLDLERGRRALVRGRRDEAERFGAEAARKLSGSGLVQEAGSLMFLASLHMPGEPDEAVRLMNEALATSRHSGVRAMIHFGLSQIHEIRGDLVSFGRSAQAACDALEGIESYRHRIGPWVQRAWAWALHDRAREAAAEAARLLSLPPLHDERPRHATVLLLAGFCALHRGDARSAISQMASAWTLLGDGSSGMLRSTVLRYLVDALLDLRAWETVREYGAALHLGPHAEDPAGVLVAARCEALRAFAAGDAAGAREVLAARVAGAGDHRDRLDAARALHHLGELALELGDGPGAATGFTRSLEFLGVDGYGYFRARGLLGLARALDLVGARGESHRALDGAIALARRFGCRGVLADALIVRARGDVGADPGRR